MQREKVTPGDVIYIEASSGNVKRVGRSDAYASEFDLEVFWIPGIHFYTFSKPELQVEEGGNKIIFTLFFESIYIFLTLISPLG